MDSTSPPELFLAPCVVFFFQAYICLSVSLSESRWEIAEVHNLVFILFLAQLQSSTWGSGKKRECSALLLADSF